MLKKLIVATVVLGGGVAIADPKFEYGKEEEVEKVKGTEWNASAEGGVVFTTGNSETTTATAGFKAARKTGQNKLSIDGSAAYARAGVRVLQDLNGNGMIDNDSEIVAQKSLTAEALAAKIRYDRFLTKFNSLFVAVLGSRDLPAGKEAVVGAQLGYSRQLYKSKSSETVAELGYDYSHENLVTGDPISIHSGRAFVGDKAELTAGTTFETSGELLTNFNKETLATAPAGDSSYGKAFRDTRFNFKASISAKIGKNLAVQTALEARYDNRPGPLNVKGLAMGFVPEASKLDTIMKASLIYTIF